MNCVLIFLCILLAGCGGDFTRKSPTDAPPPTPPPPPIAGQAGNISVSPQYAALGLAQTQQFRATASPGETIQWSVNGVVGGNPQTGTIDSTGLYTSPGSVQYGMNAVITAADARAPLTNYATAVAAVIAPGIITDTANPQVADYFIYLPSPGEVQIEFGPSTDYGLMTWSQATQGANGGQVSILVAGMRAQSTYHMRALVTLNNGATYADVDGTFVTGSPPATAPVTVSLQSGKTPQPGITLFDTLLPHEQAQAFATDPDGKVIWTYSYPDGTALDTVQPIEPLPNGHFLVLISYASSAALRSASIPSDTVDAVREVDLAGNTIREVTEAQLAAAVGAKGSNINLVSLHHDVLALANGHWVLLASAFQSFNDLPGYPGTTNVLGDVLVDVDENGQAAWVWNSFDHLDVNRHPYLFPDWTHSNSMLYSADDHNLLLSVRHQNWIIKIDYADGQGSGKILWRLGEGGDFTLQNGVDPTDWFYAQHGLDYFTPNTTGVFALGVMDNGDDRTFPGGAVCGKIGTPGCYSAASVYQVNEIAMTATLVSHYVLPANLYSYFGGNVQQLPNGDMMANFCATQNGSLIQEIDLNGAAPQLVWQAQTKGTSQYRVTRMPSLYPGIQW